MVCYLNVVENVSHREFMLSFTVIRGIVAGSCHILVKFSF